jgi:hypothetical protein
VVGRSINPLFSATARESVLGEEILLESCIFYFYIFELNHMKKSSLISNLIHNFLINDHISCMLTV